MLSGSLRGVHLDFLTLTMEVIRSSYMSVTLPLRIAFRPGRLECSISYLFGNARNISGAQPMLN